MPTDRFTNVPSSGSVLRSQVPRTVHSPYAASGFRNLTAKEKMARKASLGPSLSLDGAFDKTANYGGGYSTSGFGGGNTAQSGTSSGFSPQLSTDFLELPQSARERRELYRHYYRSDPLVGQAIDLHTELPLSKVRLSAPKPRTFPERFKSQADYGRYILSFFEKMCKRIKLFQRLITGTHHYWLDGNTFFFAEDSTVEVPLNIGHKLSKVKTAYVDDTGAHDEGDVISEEKEDRDDLELAYYQKHYQGWDRLVLLPMDQVQLTSFDFTDKVVIEMLPSARARELIMKAKQGDERALRMVEEIPAEVRDHVENGQMIPLGTDPDEGSFCFHLCGRKGADDELGSSILDRCLRTLNYREKLRQSQTQIATRNMTPKRLIWGENLSEMDTEDLREQVDMSLLDPDYSIVTNYEVHWEEIGSKDRLLDLNSEYEITDKMLYAGLGVTESLLNGESTFSGDRVKLEVLNTRYLHFREVIQEFVEEFLFKPVARRKGFIEKDEWGDEIVLYPRLSFTRLALRDSQDTYDALFNLYQKGSISIDLILEMFNIDPDATREKIEADMFTVNDATFNEVSRGIYGEAGRVLTETTNVVERLAKYMKLEMKPQPEAEDPGRF